MVLKSQQNRSHFINTLSEAVSECHLMEEMFQYQFKNSLNKKLISDVRYEAVHIGIFLYIFIS